MTTYPADPLDVATWPDADPDTCRDCWGAGELDTGRTEHDTNAPITDTCPACEGAGQRGPL